MKDHPAIDFIPIDVEREEDRFSETLDSPDIENEHILQYANVSYIASHLN